MFEKGEVGDVPKLDPFSAEATQFDVEVPPLGCCGRMGLDWVRCNILLKLLCKTRLKYFSIVLVLPMVLCYVSLYRNQSKEMNEIRRIILSNIESAMFEKGQGCDIPKLDPFSPEATQFDEEVPPLDCCGHMGLDWVRCHMSECKIRQYIQDHYTNIICSYQDIIYESDRRYYLGQPVSVQGGDVYVLEKSDHVKVSCTGYWENSIFSSSWTGYLVGYRTVVPKPAPPGREDTVNVLIFGFDSTSRSAFIRLMPKSYKVITETLKAHVFEGFNVVGDATVANLLPLMTGMTEVELPDARRSMSNITVDGFPWIWHKLRDDGYQTAYYEDMPSIGTFQMRLNGFAKQPADHYLRDFFLEISPLLMHWNRHSRYCVGDTPSFKLMMNITKDFHTLPGKKFSFTFVADITHEDLNMITLADDDFVEFLKYFWTSGLNNDTLLVVMGDHGSRYSKSRNTFNGKMEERLPLLSILLPKILKQQRPTIDENLRKNSKVLVTSHDLYATVMDALDWKQHWNPYKVKGADITRGLTLFEPIPTNRSCGEAGIEPHWCSCLKWDELTHSDPLYEKAANSFVEFINRLTEGVRSRCVLRSLKSIHYVQKQIANERLMTFYGSGVDKLIGSFTAQTQYDVQNYQLRVTLGPGVGIYEATMKYDTRTGVFIFNERDVSRTSAYGDEPNCISGTYPHLRKYCYCHNY